MTIPSAAEHTAGPWVENPIECDWSIDTGGENYFCFIGPEGETPVAAAVVDSLFGRDDELDANARLIVAAPDLLDALEAAKGFVRQHYAPAIDSEHALMEKIMSAIAKATGAKP